MKKFLAALLLTSLLTACSPVAATASLPQTNSLSVDQFLVVALEYAGPRQIIGVDTLGPTPKEALCERAVAAAVAQGQSVVPAGHFLSATCLHIRFTGPLTKGAVVVQPFVGQPLEVISIAVEFTGTGDFVGAQALHPYPDAATCVKASQAAVDGTYKAGKVPNGGSLLVYCLPVPVAPVHIVPQTHNPINKLDPNAFQQTAMLSKAV